MVRLRRRKAGSTTDVPAATTDVPAALSEGHPDMKSGRRRVEASTIKAAPPEDIPDAKNRDRRMSACTSRTVTKGILVASVADTEAKGKGTTTATTDDTPVMKRRNKKRGKTIVHMLSDTKRGKDESRSTPGYTTTNPCTTKGLGSSPDKTSSTSTDPTQDKTTATDSRRTKGLGSSTKGSSPDKTTSTDPTQDKTTATDPRRTKGLGSSTKGSPPDKSTTTMPCTDIPNNPRKTGKRKISPYSTMDISKIPKRGKRMQDDTTTASELPRDWSSLPKDIIDTILGKLPLLADYDRFGSVCRSWRGASLDPPNRVIRIESKLSPTFPLLIMPSRRPGGDPRTWKHRLSKSSMYIFDRTRWEWMIGYRRNNYSLYDLFRRKLLLQEFKLPDLSPRMGLGYLNGSSHGWLIFKTLHDQDLYIKLVNPFYFGGGSLTHGGGGMICLPPLVKYHYFFHHCKVVLSADPALAPNDYVVAFMGSEKLATFKSGQNFWKGWAIGECFTRIRLQDVYSTSSNIYVVEESGCIYSMNIMDLDMIDSDFRVLAPLPTALRGNSTNRYYIVESPDNDLLLVYRSKENNFRVFELVVQDGGHGQGWNEITNLANTVIYVGRSHSTCICIPPSNDLPGFQTNSIYFDDDGNCEFEECASPHAPFEGTGIFSLDEKSIHQCYHLVETSNAIGLSRPFWFLPSLPGRWSCTSPSLAMN